MAHLGLSKVCGTPELNSWNVLGQACLEVQVTHSSTNQHCNPKRQPVQDELPKLHASAAGKAFCEGTCKPSWNTPPAFCHAWPEAEDRMLLVEDTNA